VHNFLVKTCWVILLAWFCGVNSVVHLARPIGGEPVTDEAVAISSKSTETPVGPKNALPFPSNLPPEVPFRGDAELFSSATRATGSVVLLVSLILMGSFLLKRYWPGRFGAVLGERYIEVLETVALGERQSLTLVQIGQSRLLLARTTGSITLLDRAEVTTGAVVDTELIAPAERGERSGNEPVSAPTSVASVVGRVRGWVKSIVAKVKATLQLLTQKTRRRPAETAPSFEQIMQAQLGVTAPSKARTGIAARSRLSEIRNRLERE